jgi:3-hydroxyacyl-CoA dehydrogenase
MSAGQVRVTVVGTGDIGRGWAALCVAAGWPVSLFDIEARALGDAPAEIAERARMLVELERASKDMVEVGIRSLTPGRSILQACADSEWVIEAGPEDLLTKQKMFETIESVAQRARAITSSTRGFQPKDVAARCVAQHRCFVAHPGNPVELIPLVEIVAGPGADLSVFELLKGWLRALGRIPVTVKRPVAGNIANRIAAAVWREAIHLVLEGVVDVDDLDRAVSVGPALEWAAAGPHLTYLLAARQGGAAGFIQRLLQIYEPIWQDMPQWSRLEPDEQRKLVQALERAYEGQLKTIRAARDRRLGGILRGLEQVRAEP